LSPYLFLICVEGFMSLLAKAKSEGRLQGVAVGRRAPSVTSLLFVDDSLIFVRLIKMKCRLFLILYSYMLKFQANA